MKPIMTKCLGCGGLGKKCPACNGKGEILENQQIEMFDLYEPSAKEGVVKCQHS